VRELETHVIVASRLELLSKAAEADLMTRLSEVGRLVTGLANSLAKRP
jgi:hypothetical protein